MKKPPWPPQRGDKPYSTHMVLTINSFTRADEGQYRCVAKNSRGETEGNIRVHETTPPTPAPTEPFWGDIQKFYKGGARAWEYWSSLKNSNLFRRATIGIVVYITSLYQMILNF